MRFAGHNGTKLADYKQVTVLFADVVHSMDVAAAVGAERLREIMTDLVSATTAVVQRYGERSTSSPVKGSWQCSVRQSRWRITPFARAWPHSTSRTKRNAWPLRSSAVMASRYVRGSV